LPVRRGTGSSNPSPSSAESDANLTSSIRCEDESARCNSQRFRSRAGRGADASFGPHLARNASHKKRGLDGGIQITEAIVTRQGRDVHPERRKRGTAPRAVDPALDVRSEHPRQILQGFVGPMVQSPPSHRLPNRLQRLRTGRWQEGSAIATAMPDRLSRTKGAAKKVKRLDRKVATPVRILTIDELRLRRMKNQPTGPEADLQGIPTRRPPCEPSAPASRTPREGRIG
jgi:hypothetical protein